MVNAPAEGQAGAAWCCHRAKCFWLGGWIMQRSFIRLEHFSARHSARPQHWLAFAPPCGRMCPVAFLT